MSTHNRVGGLGLPMLRRIGGPENETAEMPKPVHTPIPTLDRENYAPIFLSNIANKYSRGASRQYLKLFGIGIIECRILALLAYRPDITANEICAAIDVDKAAVSRSLRVLQTHGHVTLTRTHTRRRTICLTESGVALHDKIMVIGTRREQALLKGFSPSERTELMGFLHRLLENAADMNDRDFSEDVVNGRPAQGETPRAEVPLERGTPDKARIP